MTTAYRPRERGGPDLRGNATDRKRRREWLLETFRADVDIDGQAACRCYRCGDLLTIDTLTVDRIDLGRSGGRYTRDNIRPACETCNKSTGSIARWENEGQPW